MRFLFKDLIKSFIRIPHDKIKIAFVIPRRFSYSIVMASTRIRVYDVINIFENESDYFIELYKPWRKYHIVIFQKMFDESAYEMALNLKGKGTKIVLDVNVNYYDKESKSIKDTQYNDILRFTEIADAIITPSQYIRNFIEKIFQDKFVEITDEYIPDVKFESEIKSDVNSLIWMGYSVKAKEVLLIGDVLKRLRKSYDFHLFLIAEKDPKISIDGLDIRFVKYRSRDYLINLLKGDIFITPRDLDETYNLGHSFTRIGIPMSVGLPVIASSIPSYRNSPAILIDTLDEEAWYQGLKNLFDNYALRQDLSKRGMDYVRSNYSEGVVKSQYINLFKRLIDNEQSADNTENVIARDEVPKQSD